MIYITSDLHFNHNNIIKYCNRPTTPEDQTEWLLEKLSVIKPEDEVYHLGDFAFGKAKNIAKNVFPHLRGHWHWIKGNHDGNLEEASSLNTQSYGFHQRRGFRESFCASFLEKTFQRKTVIMCHYPFEVWNKQHHGAIHLHGHMHGSTNGLQLKRNRIDVGFDANDFKILTLDEVFDKVELHNKVIEKLQ